MPETTDSLMIDLGTSVAEIKALRMSGNEKRVRGETIKIFVIINKLKDLGENGIDDCISQALAEADLEFDSNADYRNICWHCYREDGIKRNLVEGVDPKCPSCGWLICPECQSCQAPEFGKCHGNDRRKTK
jgi:hypothetical protein